MATPVRAYSYSRFSRFHQGKGDSARRQQRMVDDYCQRHGLLLDDSLNLNDFGVSAFRGRHHQCGALSQFLEGVRTGIVAKGSHFLVEDVDRLSREPVLDHLELVTDLLKSRITLALLDLGWQLTPDMLNKPGESWRIQALVSMMERAHGESARKSDMIGQVHPRERQEEAAGLKKHKRPPPGWIEWDDEAQDYRLHPIHAPTTRRVFE